MMKLEEALIEGGKILGIEISCDMLDSFRIHYELLTEFNKHTNLTSIEGEEEVAVKHFLDSLTYFKATEIMDNQHIVDVGSGAGFPGIPLKVKSPLLAITLVESSLKRVKFLECLISSLRLPDVKIIRSRAEDMGRINTQREKYDVAVARGVAELAVLSELCLPLVKPGGVFIAFKGPSIEGELTESGKAIEIMGGRLEKTVKIPLPWNHGDRSLVIIKKERYTPDKYPRRAGIPKKRPIKP